MMQRLKKCVALTTDIVVDFLFPKDFVTKHLESIDIIAFTRLLGTPEPSHEIQDMFVAYDFKSPHTKHLIHQIKFSKNKKLAEKVALVFYEKLLPDLSEKILFEHFTAPILIPIPTSKKRLQERGFNQCEIIATYLTTHDHKQHFTLATNILKKHKDLETQVGKTRKERLDNLKDCFSVTDKDLVKNKNIILFDDVVTTGATLNEAERTLKRAGARKVWCVALAH